MLTVSAPGEATARPSSAGSVRPATVAAVVAAAYAAFVLVRLGTFGWEPSAFMVPGDGILDIAQAPDDVGVNRGIDGYDGQAYYRLGRAPLTDDVADHGIEFRRPAYWQTRIGYPATVWVLSGGGSAALVPTMMLVVTFASVCLLALAAATLARDLGRSPWWGLVPAGWAGYVVGVAQDLTEPLAGALLVAALLALHGRRWLLGTAALTGAALTRETTLVLAVAVVGAAVVSVGWSRYASSLRSSATRPPKQTPLRSSSVPPWWVGAVPLVVYAGWRTWVRHRWSEIVPDPPSDSPLGPPLLALGRYAERVLDDPAAAADNLVLLLPCLAAVVVVACALRGADGPAYVRLALVVYLVVLVCLPVWDRSQAYLRWAGEPVTLGWLLLLGARPGVRLVALGVLTAVLWAATVLATVRYPGPERWVEPPLSAPAPARS